MMGALQGNNLGFIFDSPIVPILDGDFQCDFNCCASMSEKKIFDDF